VKRLPPYCYINTLITQYRNKKIWGKKEIAEKKIVISCQNHGILAKYTKICSTKMGSFYSEFSESLKKHWYAQESATWKICESIFCLSLVIRRYLLRNKCALWWQFHHIRSITPSVGVFDIFHPKAHEVVFFLVSFFSIVASATSSISSFDQFRFSFFLHLFDR